MTPARLGILVLGLGWASACSSAEGACFSPGEACGTTLCSQFAYCNDGQHCLQKKADGESCTEARQCTGDRCEAGLCAGGPVVCKE